MTVEANPETVTPELAALLRAGGVTRVSLGAQSFQPRLLGVLERARRADDVRRAFYALRDAGFDNISLDLIYGIPGQSAADLERDLDEALALGPDHLSCYELEAKPGTRFTHTFGDELARQAEAMEGYFEQVVERLTDAGYRWYETANFCRSGRAAGGAGLPLAAQPRLLARPRLPRPRRRRGLDARRRAPAQPPGLPRYLRRARSAATPPPRELEPLDAETRRASGSCSACGSTSRSRWRDSSRRSTTTRSHGSSASGSPRLGPSGGGGRSR